MKNKTTNKGKSTVKSKKTVAEQINKEAAKFKTREEFLMKHKPIYDEDGFIVKVD